MTSGLRVKTRAQKLYYLQFMIRRTLMILIILDIINSTEAIQIIMVTFINLWSVIYTGMVEPHNASRLENRIIYFNEFMVLFFYDIQLIVTDFANANQSSEQVVQVIWQLCRKQRIRNLLFIERRRELINIPGGLSKTSLWTKKSCPVSFRK